MKKLLDKFKIGKHYRMERFTYMFCTLFVCFTCVIAVAAVQSAKATETLIGETAMYTTAFTTSRTDVKGTVEGVYTSDDDKRTLVMLKFNNVGEVSIDAKNYQLFLTGANVERNLTDLKGSPAGSIYMFGNSGYMGVYLVNNEGFDQQILDLVVRANSEIIDAVPEGDREETSDGSFNKYDQFRINFNPAGTKAESLDCLNGDKAPTALDIYTEAILEPQEIEIREDLNETAKAMRSNLSRMQEFESRLLANGVDLPAQPELIRGDEIIGDEETGYYLDANTVLAKGHDVDLQGTRLRDGYLADIRGDLSNNQYLSEKRKEVSKNEFKTSNIEWFLSDGTSLKELASDSDGSDTLLNAITNDSNELMSVWRSFYENKVAYQVTHMTKLLQLETEMDYVKTGSTVNISDSVLICY